MKKTAGLLSVAVLAGAITLGSYKLFIEETPEIVQNTSTQPMLPAYTPVNYTAAASSGIDFTEAAARTVNGVVHVINKKEYRQPRNMMEFLRGGGQASKGIVGAGSGVIISGDGFIVTNNHVIDGASEVEVTMNNNKTYTAEIIGADENADIALLKIEADGELPYIPFADSDATKVGEWVLAVGNPFNLTSTVTAGIVSAKARDIDESDRNFQSFIQTDAAINPGNSGGALVNMYGELVGINTAITSQTGSYVGYAFAVPSNNTRKIVEDIMQYGSVQKGILGVTGSGINAKIAEIKDLKTLEGFYVDDVELEGGAEKAGIKSGDVIKKLDNVNINKFSDLSGYLSTKRPDDIIQVEILRGNNKLTLPVTLVRPSTYDIEELGIKVKNITKTDLKKFKTKSGVLIYDAINERTEGYDIYGKGVIVEVNDTPIKNIDDIKNIFENKDPNKPIKLVIVNTKGERESYIFN